MSSSLMATNSDLLLVDGIPNAIMARLRISLKPSPLVARRMS